MIHAIRKMTALSVCAAFAGLPVYAGGQCDYDRTACLLNAEGNYLAEMHWCEQHPEIPNCETNAWADYVIDQAECQNQYEECVQA